MIRPRKNIGVNLMLALKYRDRKVSPPFEGGVAGSLNYLICTKSISRTGWLIYSFLSSFISMKNKNFFNRGDLISFRNKSTLAAATFWEILNQPPRLLQAFAIVELALYCVHPSFKKEGKLPSYVFMILLLS